MTRYAVAILLALTISPIAQAETYRCTLPHVLTVTDKGRQEDNKSANANTEFFLAIDKPSSPGAIERGTSSYCTQAVCSKSFDIIVSLRTKHKDGHSLRLLLGPG